MRMLLTALMSELWSLTTRHRLWQCRMPLISMRQTQLSTPLTLQRTFQERFQAHQAAHLLDTPSDTLSLMIASALGSRHTTTTTRQTRITSFTTSAQTLTHTTLTSIFTLTSLLTTTTINLAGHPIKRESHPTAHRRRLCTTSQHLTTHRHPLTMLLLRPTTPLHQHQPTRHTHTSTVSLVTAADTGMTAATQLTQPTMSRHTTPRATWSVTSASWKVKSNPSHLRAARVTMLTSQPMLTITTEAFLCSKLFDSQTII